MPPPPTTSYTLTLSVSPKDTFSIKQDWVTPSKAGIQGGGVSIAGPLDPRFRGGDEIQREPNMDSFSASDGICLCYRIDDFTDPWKEAPVLLLLHAAMGSARRYYAWVPPLSRHYRVVRMDLRGHGSSEIPPADRELTLERLWREVLELMDHLGCARAHIVGNSAGGYLGQPLGMNHGELGGSPQPFGSRSGSQNS